MPITKASSSAVAPGAKGDLVVGNATNDSGILAVGSANQVLTVDSSTATGLKWATPAAGGMTLISSTDVTGQSTHTVSSIPDTYRNLMIYVKNYRPSSTGQLRVRFNSDSTANRHYDQVQGTTSNINFGSTSIRFSNGQESTTTSNSFGFGLIADYANTTTWKTCDWFNVLTNVTNTNNFNYDYGVGIYNQVGAVTSLQFFPATGSFNGGVIEIYGVK